MSTVVKNNKKWYQNMKNIYNYQFTLLLALIIDSFGLVIVCMIPTSLRVQERHPRFSLPDDAHIVASAAHHQRLVLCIL